LDYFYYWPDYQKDTVEQTRAVYQLHRETDKILEIGPGATIWCVVSIDKPSATKCVALGAKIIAKKSGSHPASHAHYRKYGPHYFVASRTGTVFYEVDGQAGLEDILRTLSFPVRAEHVGLSFQGNNGFRALTAPDSKAFREFAATLSVQPKIKVAPERTARP
jgi:hypothetical protein